MQLKETLMFNAPKYTDQDIALLKLIEVTENLQSINLVQANTVMKIQVKENPFQILLKNWAKFSRTNITKISNYLESSGLLGQTQQIPS